jgi:hypothetical protein
MALANGSSGYQYAAGNPNEVLLTVQTTPVSKSTTATLTAAELLNGIVLTSGTTYTVTLPAGSDLDVSTSSYSAPVASARANSAFDFNVINTASGTVTIAVGATGWATGVGTLTVLTGISASFRCRKTSDGNWTLYRIV